VKRGKGKPDRPMLIAAVSDLHAGSTVALAPPRISLDDGGEYLASKAQLWLWERWQAYWRQVEETRKEMDAILVVAFDGDMTEGNHHGTTQILSGNPTAQAGVVDAVLRVPLALKPDHILGIRGTEAHVGPSAANEERIFEGLRKDGWPVIQDAATGRSSHWGFTLEHQGRRVELAHHGRVGARPWTKANAVHALSVEILCECAERGVQAPDLVLRAHMHQFVDTGPRRVRVVQMPAWQLATAFVHKIKPNAIADVGGIIVTIAEGEMEVRPVVYHPEPNAVWRAK